MADAHANQREVRYLYSLRKFYLAEEYTDNGERDSGPADNVCLVSVDDFPDLDHRGWGEKYMLVTASFLHSFRQFRDSLSCGFLVSKIFFFCLAHRRHAAWSVLTRRRFLFLKGIVRHDETSVDFSNSYVFDLHGLQG